MPDLTIPNLHREAIVFSDNECKHQEPSLFGVTDGKAIGTYLEHKFLDHLYQKYTFMRGSSAKGIDIPLLNVDIKVTSIKQPQSSCPFKDAGQKIFGSSLHRVGKLGDAVPQTPWDLAHWSPRRI